MDKKLETRNNNNNLYIAIVIAILAILITALIFKRLKRRVQTVLLTGLSDAGKTAIFTKLVFNKPKKSVTSLKENDATLNDFNLRLVDIPGAERLRSRFWEQYRSLAQRVIFVVDSTNVETKLRDLSEYLYSLLSDETLYKNNIIFTIACNKQDLDGANDRDKIKNILQNELNAIRATKTGQLGKTSDEEETDHLARQDVKEITFEMLKVEFIETSMYNLDQLVRLIL